MIVVVAGIAIREGRIMLCQRKPGGMHSLKWEFPGGKLEPGESPEVALVRELREELNIETQTGRIYDVQFQSTPDRDILILFYFTEILSGEPEPIDCTAISWVCPEALSSYDLAPMDAIVARTLKGLRSGDAVP